jgi:Tfp pilus assembly protein PilO
MNMFWDKLSRKEKVGLSLAFVFMIVAFFDRLIVSPIRGRVQQINQNIQISEKQLALDLRNVHQQDQIEKEFEKYVGFVERSGSDEEEVAKILGEIEALSRQSEIYLVDMKPQSPKDIDFYKEYNVEIEVEGEMIPFTKFLHQLNASPQLLRIKKLRLTSKEEGEKVLKSSMVITKVLVM